MPLFLEKDMIVLMFKAALKKYLVEGVVNVLNVSFLLEDVSKNLII
jgi:hypothetical protein